MFGLLNTGVSATGLSPTAPYTARLPSVMERAVAAVTVSESVASKPPSSAVATICVLPVAR